jgi:hypothetical protein
VDGVVVAATIPPTIAFGQRFALSTQFKSQRPAEFASLKQPEQHDNVPLLDWKTGGSS